MNKNSHPVTQHSFNNQIINQTLLWILISLDVFIFGNIMNIIKFKSLLLWKIFLNDEVLSHCGTVYL